MNPAVLGIIMGTLAVNTALLLQFLKPERSVFSIAVGLLLLAAPVVAPYIMGLPLKDMFGRPFTMTAYLLLCSWTFSFFVTRAGFNRCLFVVFSIVSYMHFFMITVFLLLVYIFGMPLEGEETRLLSRGLYCVFTACLLPLFRLYLKSRVDYLLEAVDRQNTYLIAVLAGCVCMLGYSTNTLVLHYHDEVARLLCMVTVMTICAFYFALYSFIIKENENQFLNRKMESARELVKTYEFYELELGEREKSLRTLRHDFKHMLSRLDALAEDGRTDEVRAHIRSMADMADAASAGPLCENTTANAVISQYFAQARRNKTNCSAKLYIPEKLPLPEAELCMLLGNAMENALKGAAPLGEAGYIKVEAKPVKDRLVMSFINNHQPDAYEKGCSLGLASMRELCARHGGSLTAGEHEGEFHLTMILKLGE